VNLISNVWHGVMMWGGSCREEGQGVGLTDTILTRTDLGRAAVKSIAVCTGVGTEAPLRHTRAECGLTTERAMFTSERAEGRGEIGRLDSMTSINTQYILIYRFRLHGLVRARM